MYKRHQIYYRQLYENIWIIVSFSFSNILIFYLPKYIYRPNIILIASYRYLHRFGFIKRNRIVTEKYRYPKYRFGLCFEWLVFSWQIATRPTCLFQAQVKQFSTNHLPFCTNLHVHVRTFQILDRRTLPTCLKGHFQHKVSHAMDFRDEWERQIKYIRVT